MFKQIQLTEMWSIIQCLGKNKETSKKTTTYALREESKIFKCQAGELSRSKHPFELFSSDAYSEYHSGYVVLFTPPFLPVQMTNK